MNADVDRRDRAGGGNGYRLAVLVASVLASLLFIALSSNLASAAGATETATVEPKAGPSTGACELYRGVVFNTGRQGIGDVALRWGRPNASSAGGPFGVKHIADDHQGWTSYKFRAMRYIVNNAPRTGGRNGKIELTGRYAENGNTPKMWRLIIGMTKGECPNKDLPTGVITFHRK